MKNWKPILLNTPMVRATLDGRKTNTRRVMRPQPEFDGTLWHWKGAAWNTSASPVPVFHGHSLFSSAPYQPGDILYVRETWTRLFYVDPNGYTHYDQEMYYYAADGTPDITLFDPDGFEEDDQRIRWRPSIHMPKEAARLFLRVTGVSVERLKDISVAGAVSEGAVSPAVYHNCAGSAFDVEALAEFEGLWNSTIRKKDLPLYGWDANPWVWVYQFERITREEAMEDVS